MAYRTEISNRDRSGALAAALAIQAALLFVFLTLSKKFTIKDTQSPLSTLNFNTDVPLPQPPPTSHSKPKEKDVGSAARNLRKYPAPVMAPRPKVETPSVQKLVTSETPRPDAGLTQGASDVSGPGTGAGGAGSGSGGNGSGGGEIAEPPRLATPVLQGNDFPREFIDQWPRGSTVFLRLRIDERGYVSECVIDRGTGIRSIDALMCNLAHDRLRFRPALSTSGRATLGWFGYAQPAPR